MSPDWADTYHPISLTAACIAEPRYVDQPDAYVGVPEVEAFRASVMLRINVQFLHSSKAVRHILIRHAVERGDSCFSGPGS